MRSAIVVATLALIALHCECAKILGIFPFPGPSQYIAVQPYLKALAARGHQVSVINALPQKEKIPNFRDIPAMAIHENYGDTIVDLFVKRSKWEETVFISSFFTDVAECVFRSSAVQRLIKSNETFDLVIVETAYTDATYGFAQHFNAPIIGFTSFGTDVVIDDLVGNISPVSFIPLVTSGLTDRMNFWERLTNLALTSFEWSFMEWVHLPKQVELYKKNFPNAKVDLLELRKNFSLVLVNQHFSLSYPRPYVPNMIEVGGMHLNHQPKPLPADMERFLNDSKEDVIYFSMGSNIQSNSLPREKLDVLLKTFASLPQRVMWKFEQTELEGKPDNVFISKWFPQPDILAHPKVKVFFTHCGLLSTIEAIYHGKPVVGMPIFYDQFLNVQRAVSSGFGVRVDFKTITVPELTRAIKEILNNPKYAKTAKVMSQRYHDQPMKPIDTAIFWTEYVLRHKDTAHMRVAAQDLNVIQKQSLDTIAVLYGGILLAVAGVIFVIWKVISLLFMNSKENKCDKQKKRQ